MALVAKGDRRAFGRLYDQSCPLLYTLSMRILSDQDEAASLLQEVYTEVWCKIARYEPRRGSPIAWLVTLTRNKAIDRLRSRTERGHGKTGSLNATPPAERLQDHDAPWSDRHPDTEMRTRVSQALAELPAAEQQALELAYYEGLSHTEIAQRLNEPVGMIRTMIRQGMNKLKASLQVSWEPA